jgi:hypothetical protein
MLLALILVLPACEKGDPAPAPAPAPAAAPAAVAPAAEVAAPGAMTKITNIQGKVLERLDASSYSYLRIAGPDGEVWAAVPQTAIEAGAEVTVVDPMLMTKFESKTLNRTFDTIYFGNLAGQAAGAQGVAVDRGKMAAAAVMGDDKAGAVDEAMAAHGSPAVAAADVHVDKAPGGLSVGEIWAQKSDLAGKVVTVRGKVVKYNGNILGKNWLHVQDGSGDPTSATHDITVTTMDVAAVGDVVTVTGTLALDQDFGAGYAYAALLQEAKVTK